MTRGENKHPICPHCRAEYKDYESDAEVVYDFGDHEVECPHCGKDYYFTSFVEFSYSSEQPEE